MQPGIRFLIIGASGFIGQEVLHALGPGRAVGTYKKRAFDGGIFFDAQTMRLTQLPIEIEGRFTHGIILMMNATIDACARDPLGSWDVNVRAVMDMVNDLRAAGVIPVFASSDGVFDGRTGGYSEEDTLCPIINYGRHKAVIEWYMRSLPQPWLIARLAKIVGLTPGPHSLIGGWMDDLRLGRKLRCASDQRFSPAGVSDIARALVVLAERGATGMYNLGGPQVLSRLELLEMLVRHIQARAPLAVDITSCSINDLNFAELRPLDTSLDSRKAYAKLGFVFRTMDSLCDEAAGMFIQSRTAHKAVRAN